MSVAESRDDRIVAEFGDGHDVGGIAARYGITVAEVYAVVEREVGPAEEAPGHYQQAPPPGQYQQAPPPGYYPPPNAYYPPPNAYYQPPVAYQQPPVAYQQPSVADQQPSYTAQGTTTLAVTLAEWTDGEGAQFLLGQALGVFTAQQFTEVRHLFWTDNPLGNELRGMLSALVRAGVLEWRSAPTDQFRWRRR